MSLLGNELQNNTLAATTAATAAPAKYGQVPHKIVNAIQTASLKTGVDFSYLMHKAGTESSFRSDIKAKTSSATGLYQFIDSTWLEMVRKHGDKYGLEAQAAQIDSNGRVSDGQTRQSILHLRKDPEMAAFMAAEYASENKSFLERTVGGDIGNTELYLAHFMGPSGAAAFINEHRHNASHVAADIFPREAASNRNVFYDPQTGQPRTLHKVYSFFDQKFKNTNAPAPASAPEQQAVENKNIAQTPSHNNEAMRLKAAKAYQHIPPSLYDPVEVRGNWNKRKPHTDQNINNVSFGTRIARTALGESAPPSQNQGFTASNLQIYTQKIYSKLSISPVEAAFSRRLNA